MKRRVCAILLAASLAVCGLTGCGNGSQSSAGQEKVRLMVWSPSEDQSKESGEWLQTMCESFAEENPQWDITFVYGVADEATAASQVSQDPEASADVFMYANDTLTTMTDANALAKFGGKYREEIEKTNSEEVLKSLTKDGDLYGIPFTTNTWFMYYDKSVFSEEDVKNLDTMLEKGVVSFPFKVYVGNAATPILSPSASFTALASQEPENMALMLPSRSPAIPEPSASILKFGLFRRSIR